MKYIKHVFFDLDHTLWDFEANSDVAFETIFKMHNVTVDIHKFLKNYRIINNKYWKLYREDKVTKAELSFGRLNDTFKTIKYTVTPSLIHNLSKSYIDVLPNNNKLFEGAIEILNYLKPKYELHIITNGFNEVQYKKLVNSGLSGYFDKVITSEEAGVKKPNPIIFNYALKKANAKVQESVMIGDNWEADIMGAKEIGFDVIFCNFNNSLVSQNIKSVSNLLAIKQYL